MGLIALIVIVGAIIWLIVVNKNPPKRSAEAYNGEIKRLHALYQDSLNGNDKAAALAAGRAYYAHIRNGELTMRDEQALANDLSTMKQ